MDDSDVELTEEDWEAAREAFRHNPALREKAETADPERKFAELHNRWGRSRFELLLGVRQPRKYSEHRDLAAFRGEITPIEALRKFTEIVHRPVDKSMLDTFLKECEECLHRYACFLQLIGDLFSDANLRMLRNAEGAEVGHLASTLCGSSKLYKQEISSVRQFLQEARVMKQMGNVKLGQFLAPTAAELVTRVAYRVQKSWEEMQELALDPRTRLKYGRVMLGIELFKMQCYPHLPSADCLETLLLEESALARVVLREQLASARTEGGDSTTDEKEQGRETTSPLISVERWSDLAIGIDERGTYWAITPPPFPGQVFPKSQAVPLPLKGNRWSDVLHGFADATERDRVRRYELCVQLGYLSPSAKFSSDRRSRPGAEELAQIEGLRIRQSAAFERLKVTLSDLRRELRELVNCEKKGGPICLRTDKAFIRSEFVVNYLMRDESERLIFGKPQH